MRTHRIDQVNFEGLCDPYRVEPMIVLCCNVIVDERHRFTGPRRRALISETARPRLRVQYARHGRDLVG